MSNWMDKKCSTKKWNLIENEAYEEEDSSSNQTLGWVCPCSFEYANKMVCWLIGYNKRHLNWEAKGSIQVYFFVYNCVHNCILQKWTLGLANAHILAKNSYKRKWIIWC